MTSKEDSAPRDGDRAEKPGRKSFLLRLPPGLHGELRRWASQEFRSLNAQIEYLLRESVRKRKNED